MGSSSFDKEAGRGRTPDRGVRNGIPGETGSARRSLRSDGSRTARGHVRCARPVPLPAEPV